MVGDFYEVVEADDGDDDDDAPTLLNNAAGPASPSFPQFRPGAGPGTDGSNNVTDITPYKKCVLSRPVLYIPPPCPPPRGVCEWQRVAANRSASRQVDVHLPDIHRREAAVRARRAADRAREERVVAAQQGHRGRDEPPRARHAARGEQGAPARLGEPRPRARAVEEGGAAREPRDQEQYVFFFFVFWSEGFSLFVRGEEASFALALELGAYLCMRSF